MSEARWRNALGEEVDLDDIDREYALNILSMVLIRRARMAERWMLSPAELDAEIRHDALVQKLRAVVLDGRDKTFRDRLRAKRYNAEARKRGLRWRAST